MANDPEPQNLNIVLNDLLRTHGTRLFTTMSRLTLNNDAAMDLFQDLFLKLRQSSELEKASNPSAYAYRAAINLAMDWRRRHSRERRLAQALREQPSDFPVDSPLHQLINAEDCARLLDAASDLPEKLRRCFVMRYIDEKPFEEIGRELKTTTHRARGLCHSAIRKLRTKFNPGRAEGDFVQKAISHVEK